MDYFQKEEYIYELEKKNAKLRAEIASSDVARANACKSIERLQAEKERLQADLDGYKKAASYWKDHYDRAAQGPDGQESVRLAANIAAIKDNSSDLLETLIDLTQWAESVCQSRAYPVIRAKEILAQQDAMGGLNKTQ
jgi:SPX domain protein involved in polyphosphate accumulation